MLILPVAAVIFLMLSNSASWAANVNLSWTNTQSPVPYTKVYVETAMPSSPSSFTRAIALSGTTASWTDTTGIVGKCYRVQADTAQGPTGYSNVACAVAVANPNPVAAMTALTLTAQIVIPPVVPAIIDSINFQPAGATLVTGYKVDDGSQFNSTRKYGWDSNRIDYSRSRGVQSDKRLDSFVFVDAGQTGTWRYTIANGKYLLTLAAGDAVWSQGPHLIKVEGVIVISGPTNPNMFITKTDVPVTVSDGELTLTVGGPAPIGNTMINYIIIKPNPGP